MAANCSEDKSQLRLGSKKANYSNFTATLVFFSSSQKLIYILQKYIIQKYCLFFFHFLTFKMLDRVPSEEKLHREKCQV